MAQKTLYLEVIGGFGNQLYQYALGRSWALRLGHQLVLDLSLFDGYIWPYTLDQLNIVAEVATPAQSQQLQRLKKGKLPNPLKWLASGLPIEKIKVLTEKTEHFDPDFIVPSGQSALVSGYWQSWRYFQPYQHYLRQELQPKAPLSEQATLLQQAIQAAPSVGIHLRRGDYLQHTATYSILGLEYYYNAVGVLKNQLPDDTQWWVFSDDPQWALENFKPGVPLRFANQQAPTLTDFEEFYCLSACHHHIIANSTFSWWAAWLHQPLGPQQSQSQQVIAPKQWFASPSRAIKPEDRFLPHWQVL